MSTNAGTCLAGRDLRDRAHALDLLAVLVQRDKVQLRVRRRVEVRRSAGVDGNRVVIVPHIVGTLPDQRVMVTASVSLGVVLLGALGHNTQSLDRALLEPECGPRNIGKGFNTDEDENSRHPQVVSILFLSLFAHSPRQQRACGCEAGRETQHHLHHVG